MSVQEPMSKKFKYAAWIGSGLVLAAGMATQAALYVGDQASKAIDSVSESLQAKPAPEIEYPRSPGTTHLSKAFVQCAVSTPDESLGNGMSCGQQLGEIAKYYADRYDGTAKSDAGAVDSDVVFLYDPKAKTLINPDQFPEQIGEDARYVHIPNAVLTGLGIELKQGQTGTPLQVETLNVLKRQLGLEVEPAAGSSQNPIYRVPSEKPREVMI